MAKWVESAALLLMTKSNKLEEKSEYISDLKKTMEEIVDLIINAQQEDGYLNIYFTNVNVI